MYKQKRSGVKITPLRFNAPYHHFTNYAANICPPAVNAPVFHSPVLILHGSFDIMAVLETRRKGHISMTKAKVFTIVNYGLSAVLWLLGMLTLLFNVLGLWVPWHLAGFGFLFYIPVPAFSHFLAFHFCLSAEKKYLSMNLISLGISVVFVLLTIFVFGRWFW